MTRLTLAEFKETLVFESGDLVRRLERGQNTPEVIQRLERVTEMLDILNKNEKSESMFKLSQMAGGNTNGKKKFPKKDGRK